MCCSVVAVLCFLCTTQHTYLACATTAQAHTDNTVAFPHLKRPIILSHRGAGFLAPENTIDGMHLGLQLGAHVLELDVRLTKDGELVVFHDEVVDRVTNSVGFVANFTLEQLRELDAGYRFFVGHNTSRGSGPYPCRGKGIKIPTFRQLLNEFWGEPNATLQQQKNNNDDDEGEVKGGSDLHRISFNIEIKDDDVRAVDALIREFSPYGLQSIAPYILVVSKYCDILNDFRLKTLPHRIPTGSCHSEVKSFVLSSKIRSAVRALTLENEWVDRSITGYLPARGHTSSLQIPYNADGISLDTVDIVQHAHDQRVEVHYWSLNSYDLMDHLLSIRTDGIITDRVDLAVRLFKERGVYHTPPHRYGRRSHGTGSDDGDAQTGQSVETSRDTTTATVAGTEHVIVALVDKNESRDCVSVTCLLFENMTLFISLLIVIVFNVLFHIISICIRCLNTLMY